MWIGGDLWLVRWGENRWCLNNTKWGHFDKSIILSNVESYWSELEEALGIRIELMSASITKEIQGHVKVRQGWQKSCVDKSRRQPQLQMGQKVLWVNHTSSKATWRNPKTDERQISTLICDINVYFHKTHKFRGRNSLMGKGCKTPTLTHVYLNHLYFHGYWFNQIMFINSNTLIYLVNYIWFAFRFSITVKF